MVPPKGSPPKPKPSIPWVGGTRPLCTAGKSESLIHILSSEKALHYTFSLHAHLEALLQPTVLTLVSMVLVDRAVLVPSALVSQVPSHRPLEKALATLTGDLAIVFPAALVRADDTYEIPLWVTILQVG